MLIRTITFFLLIHNNRNDCKMYFSVKYIKKSIAKKNDKKYIVQSD